MTIAKFTPATFATFIAAQCGDRAAAAVIRVETVRAAIVVALKGNSTQWLDGAKTASAAKGAMGKALTAGFGAVGMIAVLYKPQEAMTAAARADGIAAKADELSAIFEAAVVASLPADKTAAEKEAAKAEKEAKAATALAAAVAEEVKSKGLIPAGSQFEATPAEVLAVALSILKGGKAGDAVADEFRAVLGFADAVAKATATAKTAAHDAGHAAGVIAGRAAAMAEEADRQTAAAIQTAAAPAKGKRKSAAVAA